MEAMLTEAAAQVPALVVLAFIVVAFLRHLKSEGEMTRRFLQDQHERLREVISDNAASCKENVKHMARLTECVRRLCPSSRQYEVEVLHSRAEEP